MEETIFNIPIDDVGISLLQDAAAFFDIPCDNPPGECWFGDFEKTV